MLFTFYWFLMIVLAALHLGQVIETRGQVRQVRVWPIVLGALLWIPMFIHAAPWR